MRSQFLRNMIMCSGMIVVAACGGGGGGIASAPPPRAGTVVPTPVPTPTPTPTPIPSPTPTPSPVPFTPIAAQIFANAPPASELAAVGKGWAIELDDNGQATALRDADDFKARYDPATDSYQVTISSLGSGTLYQTSADWRRDHQIYQGKRFYDGTIADTPPREDEASLIVLSPKDATYSYLSLIRWQAIEASGTGPYGVMGIAQPTPAGQIPLSGTASYDGTVFGAIAGNSWDTLGGTARLNVDFATGTLAGSVDLSLNCLWGCSYPATTYLVSGGTFARGDRIFSGSLSRGGATTGQLSGTFAGPAAAELLARFQTTYFNPEQMVSMTAAGVILAKKD